MERTNETDPSVSVDIKKLTHSDLENIKNIDKIKSGVGNASPSDSPSENIVVYNALSAGTYTNFSGVVVSEEDLEEGAIQLRKNVSGTWIKFIIPVAPVILEGIEENKSIDNSPFTNPTTTDAIGNAIIEVEIFPEVLGKYDDYALLYFWHNSTIHNGSFIRIGAKNTEDEDWSIVGSWDKSSTGYTPTTDIEKIIINAGVYITLDWSKIPDNSADLTRYVFKKSCLKLKALEASTLNPDTSPTYLIEAVKRANALTGTYEQFIGNKYWLCYIWKNFEVSAGNYLNLIRLGNETATQSFNDNYKSLQWAGIQEDTLENYTLGEVKIQIDWSKIPDGTAWNGKTLIQNILTTITEDLPDEAYSSRDTIKNTITVKKDGTGDFQTISEAYNSILDSAFSNQYEICIYPGLYEENNLMPPPHTHTHGLAPNSVVVSSKPWKLVNTLPVFDQQHGSSKLSNMTIESWTGYCIHFDVGLDKTTLYNENLRLRKIDFEGVASNAIIGGGSFKKGTKFVWKSCIFEDGQALCHTNGNALNENVHLVFEECSFINAWAGVGSVGGFGHCVVEVNSCRFLRGINSFISWNSPIRNIDDPTLYLFNSVEWQIIGGNNTNFAPSIGSLGKTIQFSATTDIEVSGSAANLIFGAMPVKRKNGVRFEASLTSMYHIQDIKAGMDGYSARVDVFQLWKRLGDCSLVNKTLTVTAQGQTKTFTFTENYLTSEKNQAAIISQMQAVLTNVSITAIDSPAYSYENINTTEKIFIKINSADILRGEFVTSGGYKATSETPLNQIAGIVVADGVLNESVPVWTGCFWNDTPLTDGSYGLSNMGVLSSSESVKIGEVIGGCFYPHY